MGSCLGRVPTEAELNHVRYFYENIRYLSVFGGSYGFFHTPKWTVISLSIYAVMYTVMILGTLDFLYSSYLVRSNVSAFTQSFHIFLVGCVVLSASLTTTLARPKLAAMFDFLAYPHICEYSKSSYHQKLDREVRRKKNVLLIVWLCSYGVCGMVGIVNFIVDDYLGNELTMNVTDVYWKKLPFLLWWPLNAHETAIGWITLLLFESAFSLFATLMVIAAIILCFNVMDHLFNQFKLLSHSIRNLDRRAYALFKMEYPGTSPSDLESEYDSCYYDCIKQNIEHHHRLMILTNTFIKTASVPLGVPFFGGALLLGLAGIHLTTNDDARIGPKMLLFALASTEALNMFFLCTYGETMQDLSSEVYDAIFYAKWYRRSAKCRRAMLMFRCGTKHPVRITALKLILLNMETFSNLVNSAYSIFNLSSVSRDSGNKEG